MKPIDVLDITVDYYDKINTAYQSMTDNDTLKPGHCPMCGEEIINFSKVTKQPKSKNEHYREYYLKLTNNTIMVISVCDKCIDKVDDKFIIEYMRRERNSQVAQLIEYRDTINSSEDTLVRGFALVSSYTCESHSKSEDIIKDKIKIKQSVNTESEIIKNKKVK